MSVPRRIYTDEQRLCENCVVKGGPDKRLMRCKGCEHTWYCVSRPATYLYKGSSDLSYRVPIVKRLTGKLTSPFARATSNNAQRHLSSSYSWQPTSAYGVAETPYISTGRGTRPSFSIETTSTTTFSTPIFSQFTSSLPKGTSRS